MFDWEGFENRKFCVDFKNDADKMEFLKECEKIGIMCLCPEEFLLNTNWCINEKEKRLMYNSRIGNKIIYNPHTIDCSLTMNYIQELERMCNKFEGCGGCPIHDKSEGCTEWQANNPQQAIKIVQAWSDEHPREKVVTYLDKLLEVFPNIKFQSDGTPKGLCPTNLGLRRLDCSKPCIECWSQPYKEKGNE